MKALSIIEVSKKYESKMDEMCIQHLSLSKEVKLDKAKSTLRGLLFLPLSSLVYYTFAASYGLYFLVSQWEVWYFAFSGAVVTFFSVNFTIVSVRQLKQILALDYNEPIQKLEENISQLKSSSIDYLRVAAYLLPFGPFVGVFLFKVFFNFDLTAIVSLDFLTSFGLITILLEVISLFFLKAFKAKKINNQWVNALLQGSGSQVDEALAFVQEGKEVAATSARHPSLNH